MIEAADFLNLIADVFVGYQRRGRVNDRCVLFVHGLTGSLIDTWKEKSSSQGFIDLLLQDPQVQDFDVFAFGYRSRYLRGAPINNAAIQLARAIEELVQRRHYQIVLIAHSMGGLVCMRYILDQLERGTIPPIIGLVIRNADHWQRPAQSRQSGRIWRRDQVSSRSVATQSLFERPTSDH
jgi:pimeloyl-ACP methyl ester carboxylesterase